MPKYLVRLAENEYVEWSTIVDAPVSYIMNRAEAIEHSVESSRLEAEARVDRTDAHGHSALWFPAETPEELVAGNHAGPKETEITLEEIRVQYREPVE